MESGNRINLDDVNLPEYSPEEGVWHNHDCNDDNQSYLVTEFHPIRMKLCDSGNCQILSSRICLSSDKPK